MVIFSQWRGAKWWAAGTVVACAGILLSNVVYLPGGDTPRFLLEKHAWAQHAWWLTAFYFHVLGASICLTAGTPLMFPAWTRRNPAWHRRLGYVYFNAVLWMAAPTGMALALTAKGGVWGTFGFLLAGALWWLTTWQGYVAIRRRDIAAHIRAMVRSYSWALSAPVFRLCQIALFLGGMDDATNYVASLWLSIAVSIGLAESCLFRSRRTIAPPLVVAASLSRGVP